MIHISLPRLAASLIFLGVGASPTPQKIRMIETVFEFDDIAFVAHEQATPDSRIKAAQRDVELIDLKGFLLIGHGDLSVARKTL